MDCTLENLRSTANLWTVSFRILGIVWSDKLTNQTNHYHLKVKAIRSQPSCPLQEFKGFGLLLPITGEFVMTKVHRGPNAHKSVVQFSTSVK